MGEIGLYFFFIWTVGYMLNSETIFLIGQVVDVGRCFHKD